METHVTTLLIRSLSVVVNFSKVRGLVQYVLNAGEVLKRTEDLLIAVYGILCGGGTMLSTFLVYDRKL
jgi:hypothetical protein